MLNKKFFSCCCHLRKYIESVYVASVCSSQWMVTSQLRRLGSIDDTVDGRIEIFSIVVRSFYDAVWNFIIFEPTVRGYIFDISVANVCVVMNCTCCSFLSCLEVFWRWMMNEKMSVINVQFDVQIYRKRGTFLIKDFQFSRGDNIRIWFLFCFSFFKSAFSTAN